jgi:hypothetical protein
MVKSEAGKLVSRMLRRLSYAANLLAARQRVASGEYADAIEAVRAAYRSYGCERPCVQAPPELNIMCALASWNLKDQAMTFEACEIAANQLFHRSPSTPRGRRNVKYLIYYCKYLLQFAEHDFDYSRERDLSRLRLYMGGSINAAKVDDLLRRTFPIDAEWLESNSGVGSGD